MKTVVAIGELLIDFVPQQKGCALDEVVQFERVAGGAPANVAMAVARLGGHSRMVSQVGEDAFGTHILKVLNAANVDTSYTEAVPETRDVSNTLSGTGTLKPANTYSVKSLVSGKVLTGSFEEGDIVEEGAPTQP